MIFGWCQNHQNGTFKRPYEPNKSWLLYLYQLFIFLLGHLHFFVHFSSRLWRTFLRNILYTLRESRSNSEFSQEMKCEQATLFLLEKGLQHQFTLIVIENVKNGRNSGEIMVQYRTANSFWTCELSPMASWDHGSFEAKKGKNPANQVKCGAKMRRHPIAFVVMKDGAYRVSRTLSGGAHRPGRRRKIH